MNPKIEKPFFNLKNMQPTQEKVYVNPELPGKVQYFPTVKARGEALTLFSLLDREINLGYTSNVKVQGAHHILKDGFFLPLPKVYGDYLYEVRSSIPAPYLREVWICHKREGEDVPTPIKAFPRDLQDTNSKFLKLKLGIPVSNLRENIFLRFFFYGEEWQKIPLKKLLSLEYVVFQPWFQEKLSVCEFAKHKIGNVKFYPSGPGFLQVIRPPKLRAIAPRGVPASLCVNENEKVKENK